MTFRNNQKYKQSLNIQIEQSPSQMPQNDDLHIQNSSDGQNNQFSNDDPLQEHQGQEIEDQQGISDDEASFQQDLNSQHDQFQQQQQHDLIQGHDRHKQYNQGQNNQHYLINQNQYPPKTIHHNMQTFTAKNHNHSHSLSVNQLQESPKDPQVQKIIQDVLYKRKFKQKQNQLLQSILQPQTKHQNLSSLYTYQQKPTPHLILQKLNQNINSLNHHNNSTLNDNYELITKCKQLESKIRQLARKKVNIQKGRKIKEQGVKEREKKSRPSKSKQQLSLQKLQKRLQKAVQLNLNLSKRVKLQKSKLSSIISLSQVSVGSKKNLYASIDQQSTIRHAENSYRFNQSIDKNNNGNSGRSGAGQYDKLLFKEKSPLIVHESSISKKSQGLMSDREESCKECHKAKRHECDTSRRAFRGKPQHSVTNAKVLAKGHSPTKYKSPILQFNSYLIQSQMNLSPQKKYKQNIIIEDDMIQQELESLSTQQVTKNELQLKREKENKERIEKQKELNRLIERYNIMSEREKGLMMRIQDNGAKIKKYENQQFQRAIC